jgi:ankyrin repeat protein
LTTYRAAKENEEVPDSLSLSHLASFFGIVPLTRKLLKKGWKVKLKLQSHVDKKDSLSRTPLYWAASSGHEAVVKLLLEHKADVNVKGGWYGRTALYRAASNGHEAVVKLLLEHKADANAKGGYEGTARCEASNWSRRAFS